MRRSGLTLRRLFMLPIDIRTPAVPPRVACFAGVVCAAGAAALPHVLHALHIPAHLARTAYRSARTPHSPYGLAVFVSFRFVVRG